ncbi:MAG: hypothetical protein K2J39_11160 [Ruminococcus sp.]|nr:hypothetical protein [Ruminococcus sp.]
MKKKDIIFIMGLSLLMGMIWIIGEIVMGIWIAVNTKGHIFWFVLIVLLTLVISVWHSLIEDESDLEDPKRAKYQRKTNRKNRRK